ncbi:MAG TPA: thiamine-phosphate kinase [Vicinamibacterales bacterium]|nr:thiamine-phosphate kinase [Vicinamibacterales bacterium]
MAPTVDTVTERELIARIRGQLPPAPDWMLVGIGDDAAVVEPERNRIEVLTVDALVEGIHFERALVPPDAIGHRALAVNLSDLAAMGAAPRLALLSMALPAALPLADFDDIIAGFTALAARHRLHVAGGNLTRSPGPLMIDVTVMGTVKRRQALTRGGARPGDDVYVSGSIGAAAAGLRLLQSSAGRGQSSVSRAQSRSSVGAAETADSRLIGAYLRPEPRLALGIHLARNRAASACMDLSDGLADGITQIAEASGVGITIDAGALPIDPAARAVFESRGGEATIEALTGGDDYELLIAVRPRSQRRLTAAMQRGEVALTRVGRCTAERGVTLRGAGGASIDAALLPRGFTHFR